MLDWGSVQDNSIRLGGVRDSNFPVEIETLWEVLKSKPAYCSSLIFWNPVRESAKGHLVCFWIWEVAALQVGKVLPTDSAIRKGIMEKLRSECEARGEHLPEVPSFQISCSFPRWVSMEIWAGCRFLMGVTIFVRGWLRKDWMILHYCWSQLWDPNFWSTKISTGMVFTVWNQVDYRPKDPKGGP